MLTIPATGGSTDDPDVHDIPGRRKPGLAALELEEVELLGHTFATAPTSIEAACGEGPGLTIDGTAVPTSASARRDALFGLSDVHGEACGRFTFRQGQTHEVEVDTCVAFGARSVPSSALTRAPAAPAAPGPRGRRREA